METDTTISILLAATASVAFIHALAPDHWVPFTTIGYARRWTPRKLVGVTLLAGVGHVGSSVLIGTIGLALGFSLAGLEFAEGQRGQVAGLLLIGFGLAYALWGIRHARRHVHLHQDPNRTVTVWTLVAIFFLGPCEPLIPLMFVAAAHGWGTVALVAGVFGVVTLLMMVGQSLLAYRGMDILGRLGMDHSYGHALAGATIVLTGVFVMALGL